MSILPSTRRVSKPYRPLHRAPLVGARKIFDSKAIESPATFADVLADVRTLANDPDCAREAERLVSPAEVVIPRSITRIRFDTGYGNIGNAAMVRDGEYWRVESTGKFLLTAERANQLHRDGRIAFLTSAPSATITKVAALEPAPKCQPGVVIAAPAPAFVPEPMSTIVDNDGWLMALDSDRAWWAAQTLSRATEGFEVIGERKVTTFKSPRQDRKPAPTRNSRSPRRQYA